MACLRDRAALTVLCLKAVLVFLDAKGYYSIIVWGDFYATADSPSGLKTGLKTADMRVHLTCLDGHIGTCKVYTS